MDIRKIALSLLLLLIAAMPVSANPYCIYGGGNCVYFAYECVERFWEGTPSIPRSWDAGDWGQIVGQGNSEYQIIQANSVQLGGDGVAR